MKPQPNKRQTMTKSEAWQITLDSLKDEGIELVDDTASVATDDRQFNAAVRQMVQSDPVLRALAAQQQERHIRQMQQTLAESGKMLASLTGQASTHEGAPAAALTSKQREELLQLTPAGRQTLEREKREKQQKQQKGKK